MLPIFDDDDDDDCDDADDDDYDYGGDDDDGDDDDDDDADADDVDDNDVDDDDDDDDDGVDDDDITNLRHEALDVPSPGALGALYEVVRGPVTDDEDEEAAGVLVLVLRREVPLEIVHRLAVEIFVDFHVKP